jgi:hypothetical protein
MNLWGCSMGKFKIAEDGTVIREQNQGIEYKETEEEKLMHEYSLLSYEVHHLTRPTKDPEKIARYEELKKILKIDEEARGRAFKDAFLKAKEEVQAKIKQKEQPDNSLLKMAMMKLRKENQ